MTASLASVGRLRLIASLDSVDCFLRAGSTAIRRTDVSAGWSTVVLCVGCIGAGWVAGDWQRQRIAAAEQSVIVQDAKESADKLLAAERRIEALKRATASSAQQVRSDIDSAAHLRDCKLPRALSDGLLRQADRTRIPYADADATGSAGAEVQ